jgi:NADH:ubiquinone oxidoreductase subunit E
MMKEFQTKSMESLDKIKAATEQKMKDSKLIEEVKQQQVLQGSVWTEEKVMVLINIIMNMSQ